MAELQNIILKLRLLDLLMAKLQNIIFKLWPLDHLMAKLQNIIFKLCPLDHLMAKLQNIIFKLGPLDLLMAKLQNIIFKLCPLDLLMALNPPFSCPCLLFLHSPLLNLAIMGIEFSSLWVKGEELTTKPSLFQTISNVFHLL